MSRATRKPSARASGFTLIEILVALSLLAVMSVLTYRAVSGVLEAEQHVKQTSRLWQNLAFFFDQLERDALHAVNRPIRDNWGMAQPAWVLRSPETAGELPTLEWTRLGDQGVRDSDTRRIGYRLRAGTIEYLQWPVLDRALETKMTSIPVAEKITSIRWRCLTQDGRWLEIWPVPGMAENLPRALEVIVTLEDGTSVSRLIAVGST